MYRIGVLLSGGGSNLQAIIDSVKSGELKCSIEIVVSDRQGAYGIERAKLQGIETAVVDRGVYGDGLSEEIYSLLRGRVDLIVLAGFLSILKGDILGEFKYRIINIHPSLIPAFCGRGMHGIRVHEASLDYGVKYSGCTVHFVDEGTDTGPIILQKMVPVYSGDNPRKLQERVLKQEHKALPEAIKLLSEYRVFVEERRVIVK